MLQHALGQVEADLVVVRDGPDVEGHERARAVEGAEVAVDADVGARLPRGAARGGAVSFAGLVVVVAPVLDGDDSGAVVDAEDGGGGVLGGVEDLADEGQLEWSFEEKRKRVERVRGRERERERERKREERSASIEEKK